MNDMEVVPPTDCQCGDDAVVYTVDNGLCVKCAEDLLYKQRNEIIRLQNGMTDSPSHVGSDNDVKAGKFALPNNHLTILYADNQMGSNVCLLDSNGKTLGSMTYTCTGSFWVSDKTTVWAECPECKSEFDKEHTEGWSYCPECGEGVEGDWEVMP